MISSGITDVIIEVIRIGSLKTNPKDNAYLPQWSVAKTPVSKKKTYKKDTENKINNAKKDTENKINNAKKNVENKVASKPKPKPKIVSKPKPIISSKLYKPTATYSIWGVKRSPRGFAIQLGSFLNEETVKNAGKSAIESGLELVYIYSSKTNNKIIYRLLTGDYDSKEDAKKDMYTIKSKGFVQAFIRKH